MLIALVATAIILAVAGALLRIVTGRGRGLLVTGLVVGSLWLLTAAMVILFQRGGPALSLLVVAPALVAAMAAYRRFGAPYAVAIGLAIVLAISLLFV